MSEPKDPSNLESDALLDSLTSDEPEPPTRRGDPVSTRSGLPPGPKLHAPDQRDYPDDEVTMVGRLDVLTAALKEAEPVATSEAAVELEPAAELGPDEIDELDELLGAEDQEPIPTLVAPKPPEPMAPRTAVPRPVVAPTQRKQTLVGLQPGAGSAGPSIPRPAIPRPGSAGATGKPSAAPPVPRPTPPPVPVLYSLDDDEDGNEPTRVFDASLADLDLENLSPLAPPMRGKESRAEEPKPAPEPPAQAAPEPPAPEPSSPEPSSPEPSSKREEKEVPLSARTTIADDGPAGDFYRAAQITASPDVDLGDDDRLLPRRDSEPSPVSAEDLLPVDGEPRRDSAIFPDEEVVTSVALVDERPSTVAEPEAPADAASSVLELPPPPPGDAALTPEIPSAPGTMSEPWPSFAYSSTTDDRPAADHLRDLGATDDFKARAEWFEREAHAKSDPQAKTRLLLLASELWALLGDTGKSRELANEAATIGRTMALPGRQARWLAARENDFKTVAGALELEIRSSPTPEARVHAAYLSAEVHRLSLLDEATAKKKLDLAVRAHAEDPRAQVHKLAEALGTSAAPPKFKWPDQPAFESLAASTEEIVERRAALAGPDAKPAAVLAAAGRALTHGNRTLAAQTLERLATVEGLEAPAAWLSAALLSHEASTRPEAIRLLGTVLHKKHAELARRALASRALEQGDGAALAEVLRTRDSAFSAADRVALAALTGSDLATVDELVAELSRSEEYAALASAAHVAAGSQNPVAAGTPPSRAEAALARALARPQPPGADAELGWLRPSIEAFDETHREHPLSGLLALELARAARAALTVAGAIAEFPAVEDEGKPHRELARALALEVAGNADAARVAYLAALEADRGCEAAFRAVLPTLDGERAAEGLSALAESTQDRSQSALYHLELVLAHPHTEPREIKERLERAVAADPAQPLTYRVAERLARGRGDAEELSHWLRVRREAAGDEVARALDLVREALLVAESDLGRAAELLGEAVRARPSDVGLRELFERLRPGADSERGDWRETVAAQASARNKPLLLLQAAFEYERAGEQAAAARAARAAADAGGGALAQTMAVRAAIGTPEAARVSEELLARAKEATDVVEQRELYEQLSAFDRARGDTSSAILWQGALLERSPEHLPALRRLEQAYISSGREEDLEPVAAQLARLLDDPEGTGHAHLAARLRRKAGAWLSTREMADLALKRPGAPLWAVRLAATHARFTDDPAMALVAEQNLAQRAEHPLDRATLSLRAAEAATRLGNLDQARELLEFTLQQGPDHLMALTTLAQVLEAAGDAKGAAKGLEAVAEASSVDAHRVDAWHQAGVLWLERAEDQARGRLALEQAVAIDPGHEDSVLRLQSLYTAQGDAKSLARLLEIRLDRATDPEERVALEVARSRALADVGEREAAKVALSAALAENPEHVEALQAFADLCAAEGDWMGTEQALIRLARHVPDPRRQAEIYKKLGELYDGALPNPQRAELAYQEVLKRDPDDTATVQRLVAVFGKLGQPERAVELSTRLLERAATSEEKRDRTLALALVFEQIVGDKKRADAAFEKARKEWPHDAAVLRALVEHHLRAGETRTVQVLLDRSATDARRALATGRFEPSFFEALATVAELRGASDAAAVAQATLGAISGQPMPLQGAGAGAGDARLDELLAPELLTPALRALLKKTSDLLDGAYPMDLKAARAAPLALDAYTEHAQQLAGAFGIRNIELYSSPALGTTCLAVGSSIPRIVIGQGLLSSTDDAARYFLLIRGLKLVQSGAATFSRIPPIELATVVSGLLAVFASNWTPQGVDTKKVAEAQKRIQAAMQRKVDDDVPVLALEVIGSLGARATQLGTALQQWGSRTGLLAVGDPFSAMRALGLSAGGAGGASGGAGIPAEGAERLKWIVRNPEARDLTVYSVSDQYAEARARLGLRD